MAVPAIEKDVSLHVLVFLCSPTPDSSEEEEENWNEEP